MKRYKYLSIAALVFLLIAGMMTAAFAASESDLKAKKSEAEQKIEETQYQVDLTQDTVDGIIAEIERAEEEIAGINAKIDEYDQQISDADAEIEEIKAELAKTQKKLDEHLADYGKRLRTNAMFGFDTVSEILFSAEDFTDLVSKMDMVASIINADQKLADELTALKNSITEQKAKQEELKKSIEAAKAEQETLLAEQNDIKAQLDQLYAQNKQQLDEYKADLAEAQAEKRAAEEELARITAQKQAERGGGSSKDYSSESSSGYIWPLYGYGYGSITDYFGYRESPGGIGSTNHMGLDIGASTGTPIHACASGRVDVAYWNGGYGNCVTIGHDSGYTTLYGHMSSIAVYEGEYVRQGEVIGYVGSTGISTGPHLHLSFIDRWGNFVDPLNFI